MKKALLVISLLACSTSLYAADSCVEDKIKVQQLVKENAQLQSNVAQLMYNQATAEIQRLEGQQKAEQPKTQPKQQQPEPHPHEK